MMKFVAIVYAELVYVIRKLQRKCSECEGRMIKVAIITNIPIIIIYRQVDSYTYLPHQNYCYYYYYYHNHHHLWICSPARAMASSFTRFRDYTQRCATVGRTPPDE
jgi:hypothetical protein